MNSINQFFSFITCVYLCPWCHIIAEPKVMVLGFHLILVERDPSVGTGSLYHDYSQTSVLALF